MKKLKAIIVEDEQMSREALYNYLHQYCDNQVDVVDTSSTIAEAEKAIRKHKPDLVFLDIEMPHGSGFDLLKKLEVISFEVIFVTAYNQYAIQALNDASAMYYLLKPIEISALEKAVDKVYQIVRGKEDSLLEVAPKTISKIRLPVRDGFEIIDMEAIMHCESDGNYTHFHLTSPSKRLTICKTLKYYTNLLSLYGFVRISKSCLLNVAHACEYKRSDGGLVILTNGKQLSVSPKYREAFLENFFCESIG